MKLGSIFYHFNFLTFNHIFFLVSNALKPQRRFTISGLAPSTLYQVKMEAHNVAGVANAEFTFVTLTKDGEPPPPEIVQRGHRSNIFYGNVNLLIPSIATISGMICTVALIVMCYKHSKYYLNFLEFSISNSKILISEQGNRLQKESLETRQNNDAAQRERYYATIHKVSLQNNEKIPGKEENTNRGYILY